MITIPVMAVAVSLEPFRIGMTVVMLSRPRPMFQWLAFLCGGGGTSAMRVAFGWSSQPAARTRSNHVAGGCVRYIS